MTTECKGKHVWKFFKAGGMYQPYISSGEDIKHLGELDQKLWSALSCPSSGLFFDEKTLKLIDADGDSRVRHNDIVSAAKWTCSLLKDCESLMKASDSLELSNIDDTVAEGAILLSSARRILESIGKGGAQSISLSDFGEEGSLFTNTLFNADGIITVESCGSDESLRELVSDMIAVEGFKTDRSGKPGVDAELARLFFDDARAYAEWLNAGEKNPKCYVLGDSTESAFEVFKSVECKIDDFFARAEILACNPDNESAVNASYEQIREMASAQISDKSSELANLPIARILPYGELNLEGALNPAWSKKAELFMREVALPLLGKSSMAAGDWARVKSAFEPFESWFVSRPNSKITLLSKDRISEIVSQNKLGAIMELIAKDESLKDEFENIGKVEKLVRLHKNLAELAMNYVSFQKFYLRGSAAIFQFGSLYIDRRVCRLCIRVDDVEKHSEMSALSYGYLLYCACRRKGEPDINIVALVSAGDSDNLIVGRNGVFYDRLGRDWDATVVKIVDNPIGIRQSFFSPYKRLIKWISEQIAKRASALEVPGAPIKLVDQKTKKIDVGTVAALGVAVGGITTAFGMLLDAFLGLGFWIPLGIFAIILLISAPSVFLAAMRLKMRNLAPLLDASGWAVNSKATINVAFGASLTRMGKLPRNADKKDSDPYEDSHPVRRACIAALIVLLLVFGALWYGNMLAPLGLEAPSWSPMRADASNTQAQSKIPKPESGTCAPESQSKTKQARGAASAKISPKSMGSRWQK